MAAKKKAPEFDARAFAKGEEESAMLKLRENMQSAQDELAQNDAAYKIWLIANGYNTLH